MIYILHHNKQLRNLLNRIAMSFDKPLASPTKREQSAIIALRDEVSALPHSFSDSAPPSMLVWQKFMKQFREAVLSNDPRAFLRWPMIKKAMCVSNQPYISLELLHLRRRSDWRQRWYPALQEAAIGHPIPFWALPCSSGNLIHHAYHLAQFEVHTGRSATDFSSVFEFGGGYGSMCRLFHQFGFAGRYVIYDLPPFSILQRFYLQALGLPVYTMEELPDTGGGILCISREDTIRKALAWAEQGETLFVGTWSVGETPQSVRERIMPLIDPCRGVLIAYAQQFEEMNNFDYFNSWAIEHSEFQWNHVNIQTLLNHFYLFGLRA